MNQLNESEKKVLTYLEIDARLSLNQIAKKTRLSAQGVLKIINRLKERKIIQAFDTKVNYSKIGYKLFPVHIKLKKSNQEITSKIKKILQNYEPFCWHTFCEGEYDLLLSFKVKDEKDKNKMQDLLNEISNFTFEKDTSIVTYAFEISKSFVKTKSDPKISIIYNTTLEPIELKNNELKLIYLLKENSKENIITLAKKTNLSSKTIVNKIRYLKKSGIITSFKSKIDMAKLDYHPAIILISLSKYTKQDYQKFITYCKLKEQINYFIKQIGKYDIDLSVNVKNINDFYKLMDEIREEFPFIKKITTLIKK